MICFKSTTENKIKPKNAVLSVFYYCNDIIYQFKYKTLKNACFKSLKECNDKSTPEQIPGTKHALINKSLIDSTLLYRSAIVKSLLYRSTSEQSTISRSPLTWSAAVPRLAVLRRSATFCRSAFCGLLRRSAILFQY